MGPARQGVVTHFLSGKTPAPLRTRGADEAHCSRTRTVGTNARASLQARPPAPRCSGVPKCDRLSLARLRAMRPRSGECVSATGRCARCAGILTRLSGQGSAISGRKRRPMQRRAEQPAAKDARGAGRAEPQQLGFGCPVPATSRCGPLAPRLVAAEAPEGGPLNSPVRPIRSCPMFATILERRSAVQSKQF